MPYNILKQPRPFAPIFFLEMWERFGFYGVQAILIIFLVQHLDLTDKKADLMLGTFSALVYLLPGLGGYVGDQLLGTKRTTLLGATVLCFGYGLISIPSIANQHISVALALIAVGNGLFKPNPSSLMAKVYKNTEYNMDSGFTLYYMAINIGSFLSLLLIPILSHFYGWSIGFVVCLIGMVIALLTFLSTRHRQLKGYGSAPDFEPIHLPHLIKVFIGVGTITALCTYFLQHTHTASALILTCALLYLLIFIYHIQQAETQEKKPMWLFLILFFFGVVFFVLYIQMQTSLTLFALRNADHHVFGIPLEAGSFQSLNSFWILISSPFLAMAYQSLSAKNKDISIAAKFSLGLFVAGLSFLFLSYACHINSASGIISGNWLFLSYGLQSFGELLISALGLALAAHYVPQRLMGYAMGIWLLSTSVASVIGGYVASMASVPRHITNPQLSMPIYHTLFNHIGWITVAISAGLFLLIPTLKKLQPSEAPIDTSESRGDLVEAT